MTVRIALLCLLLVLLPAHAAIYKQVDENGKVTFTDRPEGKAVQPEDLPTINSQPALELPDNSKSKSAGADGTDFQVAILFPANGSHIPAGQRDIEVQVEVWPALPEGYSLQAYLNGAPYGAAATVTSLLLQEVYRGEHQIRVDLIDPDGEIVAASSPVTITVFRPTVNKPSAPAKKSR